MAETKKKERSPDLVAISRIRSALADLPLEEQGRVLTYVAEPIAAQILEKQQRAEWQKAYGAHLKRQSQDAMALSGLNSVARGSGRMGTTEGASAEVAEDHEGR